MSHTIPPPRIRPPLSSRMGTFPPAPSVHATPMWNFPPMSLDPVPPRGSNARSTMTMFEPHVTRGPPHQNERAAGSLTGADILNHRFIYTLDYNWSRVSCFFLISDINKNGFFNLRKIYTHIAFFFATLPRNIFSQRWGGGARGALRHSTIDPRGSHWPGLSL